jgi:predicted transglutaminase-like cysteine proteinase
VYWITCSNQSTRRERKHLEKDKNQHKNSTLSKLHQLVPALFLASGIVLSSGVAHALPRLENAEVAVKQKQSVPTGVFGSLELRTNSKKSTSEWHRVLDRIRSEASIYQKCDRDEEPCHPALRNWRNAVKRMKTLSGYALLSAVNTNINQLIRYRNDERAWGKADHWATPVEALTGFGDCEDFAILKYVTLSELGFGEDQLKIVVVKDQKRGIGHAVLAVRSGTQIDILDNLSPHPVKHTEIESYTPVYSVNREGRWLNVTVRKRSMQVAASPVKPRRKPLHLAANVHFKM